MVLESVLILFAFEDPTQPASQLTWRVLFRQSLSRDLQNFNNPEAVVLQ